MADNAQRDESPFPVVDSRAGTGTSRTTWRSRLKSAIDTWAGRQLLAKGNPSPTPRAVRDMAGWTGYVRSNAFDQVQGDGANYVKSFDDRIPPSAHVSSRDLIRAGEVMPLSERCIEDWNSGGDVDDVPPEQ